LVCGVVIGCKVPPASKDCSAFILQHSKKKYIFLLGIPDPEDEDTIILQNMENYSLNDKASQHRQFASSLLHHYHTKLWHNIILVYQNKTLGIHIQSWDVFFWISVSHQYQSEGIHHLQCQGINNENSFEMFSRVGKDKCASKGDALLHAV
jgi:hypothetical protein